MHQVHDVPLQMGITDILAAADKFEHADYVLACL